jgi:hypothetical protein
VIGSHAGTISTSRDMVSRADGERRSRRRGGSGTSCAAVAATTSARQTCRRGIAAPPYDQGRCQAASAMQKTAGTLSVEA